MEIQSIQNLLTQVNLISKKYEEIAKHTGENYNIFHILGKTSDELAHSKIIGDLLNPKGIHGLGDVFLKEFLSKVGISDFDTKNAKLEIEKHIGFINEDYSEGGRIDLFLSDGKQEIVIENKIYAGDQDKQLERYHNAFPKAKIIYLTLREKEGFPSKASLGKLSIDKIKCIFYSIEIVGWLEKSIKHSVNFHLLRETLTQYLNLIKHLTGKSRNNEMEKELKELLLTNLAFFENIELLKDLKNKIIHETRLKLIDNLRLKLTDSLNTIEKDNYLFYFDIEEDPDGLYFGIKPVDLITKVNFKINDDNKLKQYSKSLKSEYKGFTQFNEFYIGWITPLGERLKFEHLEMSEIFKLAQNEAFFNSYLDNLVKQCKSFFYTFENIIKR